MLLTYLTLFSLASIGTMVAFALAYSTYYFLQPPQNSRSYPRSRSKKYKHLENKNSTEEVWKPTIEELQRIREIQKHLDLNDEGFEVFLDACPGMNLNVDSEIETFYKRQNPLQMSLSKENLFEKRQRMEEIQKFLITGKLNVSEMSKKMR